MMKNLVGNTMSVILEIVLWLNLVGGAVSGYMIGDSMTSWNSNSEAYYLSIGYNSENTCWNYNVKSYLYSVRCVKD
jgi:hypothetical protein